MRLLRDEVGDDRTGCGKCRFALTQISFDENNSRNLISSLLDDLMPMQMGMSCFLLAQQWARPFDVPFDRNENALWKTYWKIFRFDFFCCQYFYNGQPAAEVYYCHDILLLKRAHSAHILWPFIALEENEHQPKFVYYYILACASRTQCQQMPETTSVHMYRAKHRRNRHVTRWFRLTAIGKWNEEKKFAKKRLSSIDCSPLTALPRDARTHTHTQRTPNNRTNLAFYVREWRQLTFWVSEWHFFDQWTCGHWPPMWRNVPTFVLYIVSTI